MSRRRPLPAIDVKAMRARMGITQRELAKRVWETDEPTVNHERTISTWENGHRSPHPMARNQLERVQAEHEKAQRAAKGEREPAKGKTGGPTRKALTPPETAAAPPPRRGGVVPGFS